MNLFANLDRARYMSLGTFRRDGTEVRTPVWFAESERGVVFMTNPKLAKVKRIRRNPRVRVAPCTVGGKVTGEWAEGVARFLEGDEARAARSAIKKKYW